MTSAVLTKQSLPVDEITSNIRNLVSDVKTDSIRNLRTLSRGLSLSSRLDKEEQELDVKQRKISAQSVSVDAQTLDRYREGYADGTIQGVNKGMSEGFKKGMEYGLGSVKDIFDNLPKEAKIVLGGIAGLSGLLSFLDIDVMSPIFEPTGEPGPGGKIGKSTGVIYDPGQPGLDISFAGNMNRVIYPGEVVEIGHQYNPNTTGGDGRKGSGYGNYIVVRAVNPITGGLMDTLYAHFPDGELNKFKEGDQVSRGQLLGRMATAEEFSDPRTRPRVGSGTSAHMSLDFLKPDTNEATEQIEKVREYTDKGVTSGAFDLEPKVEEPSKETSSTLIEEKPIKLAKATVDPVLTEKRAPSISQEMEYGGGVLLAIQPVVSQTVVNNQMGSGGGSPIIISGVPTDNRVITLAKNIT